MKYYKNYITLSMSLLLSLVAFSSCSNTRYNKKDYVDQKVNIYRKKDTVDKQITLRFYNDTPHVPYISVTSYYKEFFLLNVNKSTNGNYIKYSTMSGNYLGFNLDTNVFSASELFSFNYHPGFRTSSSKTFVKLFNSVSSDHKAGKVDLDDYFISIHREGNEIYMPLTFLSKMGGGFQGYNVAYNGQDIYIIDRSSLLMDIDRDDTYYGETYFSLINDLSIPRYSDFAEYNYYELCFTFDQLRGKTSQLIFGDNNLLTLGLDGLLEQYYPKIKQYLLSTDREEYYIGLSALFAGLYDGGHTGIITNSTTYKQCKEKVKNDNDLKELSMEMTNRLETSRNIRKGFADYKTTLFNGKYSESNPNYYSYDNTSKTAYIGFDSFDIDYTGWTNYYDGTGDIPNDTYAFIRSSLYHAKEDNAENVILDITSNGGGNSYALVGIVGLLNNATARLDELNTFNQYHTADNYKVDINLDGKWDYLDTEECARFDFNFAVMTSPYSFSCGNLLPSVLKEAGYKIIGQRSGGGSCAITIESTSDGISYVRSSYLCLCDSKGNHIDGGIPVDYEIPLYKDDGTFDCSKFFDYTTASEYLSTAYAK